MRKTGRKSNTMLKLTLREIKNTFGRFFAVFAIIALGTGFFSGVRITTPVMVHSVDEYYRENQLYDYRAISTLGWEEDEVKKLSEEPGVRSAEGAWQYDVLCEAPDGTVGVYKVYSITKDINNLQLTEGKMPTSRNECLLDSRNRMGLEIGDTIRFSEDNDSDILDMFEGTSYTVTGFIESALYINFERGTTSIGNGTVLGFMYVPRRAFSADYYSEIYVKLDKDPVIYSDEYETRMDELRPEWEKLIQVAADNRYNRLYDDAKQEILDGRAEFEEEKAEAEQELRDVEAELADGKKELDDVATELADGKEVLDDVKAELDDGKAVLDDTEKGLAEGKEELDNALETIVSTEDQLLEAGDAIAYGGESLDSFGDQLASARSELDAAEARLKSGGEELDAFGEQLNASAAQLAESKERLDQGALQLEQAETSLAETKAELASAGEQLAAGKAQLDNTETQLGLLMNQLVDAQGRIDAQQAELDNAIAMGLMDETAIAAKQAEIEEATMRVNAGWEQYSDGWAEYSEGLAEYESNKAMYDEGMQAYEFGLEEYQAFKAEYEAGKAEYEQGLAKYQDGKAAYEEALLEYNAGVEEYQAGLQQYEEGLREYEAGIEEYNAGVEEYEAGLAEFYDGKAEYEAGVAEYEDGLKAYQEARQEYEDGKAEYEDALKEYEEGIKEYVEGRAKYDDGVTEFEDAKATFDTEMADAEQELQDAEEELEDLDKPETFLLERSANIGYACFETDSQIVEQVARILPIFFILVAILVCMTTMTRMVDERRGQIGILKGLGYSRRDIMRTFLAYSGLAAMLGCIFGYAVGVVLFPSVIWYAYEMMYIQIPIHFIVNWKLAAAVFLVSMISTLGTTYLSCRNELSEPAASLMRPKAPKAGKRIFLENIPAIWNRLKFMQKVSIRNIFRYKKRFFMMVVGISGCTALLITGFGLKDSIATFVDAQYDDIQIAKAELILDEITDNKLPDELSKTMSELGASSFLFEQASWDLETEDRVRGVTTIVPADWSDIDSFFRLRTMDEEIISPPKTGEAVISISVSEHYGLDIGDELVLRNEDMETVTAVVTGIFRNHVYDYVLMSRETMENAGLEYHINGAYVNFPEDADIYEAQAKLAGCEGVVSVSVFSDFRERIANMMSSLNYVVLLIILSAAALAFVVLYNLTNINIIERTREIATIKVLGFYRRETSDYVFRENMFLTLIGTIVGIGLGIFLHGFVIDQIVVDLVYFQKEISLLSFLFSIILTFSFTFIVNRIMTFKLDKINMAESLKSVD